MQLIQPHTQRLLLRQWTAQDRVAFATLNADAEVMRYFPKPLTRAESDQLAEKLETLIADRGWGLWAVELKETSAFLGFVGLHETSAALPFPPTVEVGWRLNRPFWGHGYATEAAQAALRVGFEQLGLDEIVSMTALQNVRSQAVMERLGMLRDTQTFEHPAVPAETGLREHCLYRLQKSVWSDRDLRG